MRLFIALELPAPVKQALAEAQTELRRARASVSWSKPENLHLTLKFLGETDAARLPELAAAGAATAAKTAPFALELTQVGGFPNLRQPRVLWVGLTGAHASLLRLHGELETQLAAQGVPRETKPLHPHLTLGARQTRRRRSPVSRTRAARPSAVRGVYGFRIGADGKPASSERLHLYAVAPGRVFVPSALNGTAFFGSSSRLSNCQALRKTGKIWRRRTGCASD